MSPLHSLQREILTLESELRALAGKLGNRAPEQAPAIEIRNLELAREAAALESSLLERLFEQRQPRQADEALQRAEILRLATVDYCQQSQIDPELWKNIAF